MTYKRLLKGVTVLLLFVLPALAFSQNRTVSGTVTDDKGTPIAGATVIAKGTTSGVSTGTDGTYSLSVPASARTIIITSVGFATQEVTISGKTTVDIALIPQDQVLTDVVVVGYGTARRKDLTGATATIREKDFNKGVITSPDQLIQGKAAGVMVIQNTGQPGGSTTVRIRGTSSIRSGNQPLFVIDGVPLSGGSARPGATGGDFGSDGGNPLNFINPNDISNIEILKDASAAAIYGSRGANGVVLITTKRGQAGVPTVDFNVSTGISNTLKKLEVLSGDEYRAALTDYGLTSGNYGGSEDAWDAISRTAFTQNYNFAIGGGNENGRYRVSVGYLDQQGIIETSQLKKMTASLTSSFKFLESKKLGLEVNILTTQTKEDIAPVSNFAGFTGNVIAQALQWNPTLKVRGGPNDTITVFPVGNTTINPVAALEYYKDRARVNTIIASISPSYKFTNDLEYKLIYSINRQVGIRTGMANRLLNLAGVQNEGVAFIGNNEQINQQITNTLSYNKRFSSLNVNALIGHEWLDYDSRGNFVSAKNFNNAGLDYWDYLQYSTAGSRNISSFVAPSTELQSFFARGIFNYDDKYLLTATIRADGSTRFGENNKYGYFPSVGFAWNIANEEFFKGNNLFDNLKLRLGWGRTGNQEFPSGASRNRFVVTGQQVFSQVNFGNPDLRWEASTTTNAGFDFAVLNNRLSGAIDYFYKKTTDVLFERTLAAPSPSGKVWVNLDGNVVNKGVEVSLTGAVIRQADLNWNISANASFLDNTVSGLQGFYETGDLRGQGFSNVLGQRVVAGQPLNVWYLAIFEGIDKTTGQSIFRGGDPASNKFYVGSPNPKMLLGISTDLTYKKWSAYLSMNGTFGHYVFNNTAATVLGIGNLGNRNIAQSVLDVDVKEAISNAPAPATRDLEKGNYLKMANATISYRVGNAGRAFRNLNISLTGQNLFILTNYTGFDPEVNTDAGFGGIPSLGVEYIPYPSARTILLGITFSL